MNTMYLNTFICVELDFSSVVSVVVEGLFNIGWRVSGGLSAV